MVDDLITNDDAIQTDDYSLVIDDPQDPVVGPVTDDDIPDEIPELMIGEKMVPLDEIEKAYKMFQDDEFANKKYTQRSQALAEERRAFEAERNAFQYQPVQPATQAQQPTQQQPAQQQIPDEIADDPVLYQMYQRLNTLEQENASLKQGFDNTALDYQKTQVHNTMKQTYNDYNPTSIEQHVYSDNYNPFEDAHLAQRMRNFDSSEPDKVIEMLPDGVKKVLLNQGRESAFKDIREKGKLRQQASTITNSSGQPIINRPEAAPKSYREAQQQTLDELKSQGKSLIS